MRRRAWSTVTCVLLLSLAFPGSAQDDPLSAEERAWLASHGPIRYGYEPNYAPFEYVDHNGQAVGINFDLLDAMARHLDLDIEKVEYPDFDALLDAARAREVDVLGTVNRTAERETFLDFSDPYVRLSSVFYVADDRYQSIDDLEGARVGVVETYVSAQWLAENHPELEQVGYADLDALLQALATGQVDAVFEESATVGYMARENGFTNVRVLPGGAFLTSDQHFATPDDSPILVGILNKGLASIPLGERTKIFEFWTGYDLGIYAADPVAISPLARNLVLAIAGIALLAFAWVATLRRQVSNKTRELRSELDRRRQAEHAIRALNEELEERVQARTQELERSNQDLEAFARTVTHDLQSPLSVIALKANLIATSPAIDADSQRHAVKIEAMVDRMKGIIRATLDYSKAKVPRTLHPVDLNEILNNVNDTAEPLIKEHKATIEVGRLPIILGSEGQLVQLFQNLIINGIKYHRDGVPPSIRIWCDTTPAGHIIHVQDNGTGFDTHKLDKMFQPFSRLEEHRDREGHGLGLAACTRIVERHNGDLTASSEIGVGSRFSITFPRVPEDLDAPLVDPEAHPPTRRSAPAAPAGTATEPDRSA